MNTIPVHRRRPPPRRRVLLRERTGSTFIALLAMIAIMLTLATVITPSVVGVLEFERVDNAAKQLAVYERAIGRFYTSLSVRPQALRQLTRQIVSTDRDSCGEPYTNRQLKDDGSVWAGPYLTRVVPSHGDLRLDIGVVKDTLWREPPVARNNTHPGELIIRVDLVQENEARALDRRVDGGTADHAGGKIRWDPPPVGSDGFVTVEYTMAVTGC